MAQNTHNVEERFADCGTCPRTGKPVRICYNVFEGAGQPAGGAAVPTILLVMGLCSPGVLWDNSFCRALAAQGPCRVIRFDNRDMGLSSCLDEGSDGRAGNGTSAPGTTTVAPASPAGTPAVSQAGMLKLIYAALQPGRRVIPEVYGVAEMALDALRLLAALGIRSNVHLVGMSLGGMIVQEMALQQPGLVASLTLISSRSANPQRSKWPSMREMLGFLPLLPRGSVSARYAARIANARTQEERDRLAVEKRQERAEVYGKAFARFVERNAGDRKKLPFDLAACERQMTRVFLRSAYMGGMQRQFLALLNAESRDDDIRRTITCEPPASSASSSNAGKTYIPTIVIHGTRDILCPIDNGRYLHQLFAKSRFHQVDGMGHTLPPIMRKQFVSWIWANITAGEAAVKSRSPSTGKAPDGGGAGAPPPRTTLSKL